MHPTSDLIMAGGVFLLGILWLLAIWVLSGAGGRL